MDEELMIEIHSRFRALARLIPRISAAASNQPIEVYSARGVQKPIEMMSEQLGKKFIAYMLAGWTEEPLIYPVFNDPMFEPHVPSDCLHAEDCNDDN
jgi:hypothetical protein